MVGGVISNLNVPVSPGLTTRSCKSATTDSVSMKFCTALSSSVTNFIGNGPLSYQEVSPVFLSFKVISFRPFCGMTTLREF